MASPFLFGDADQLQRGLMQKRMSPFQAPGPMMPTPPQGALPPLPSQGAQEVNRGGKGDLPFSYKRQMDRLPSGLPMPSAPGQAPSPQPLEGEVLPPATGGFKPASPQSGGGAPAVPPGISRERSLMRETASALIRNGSAAQRVQGLQMLAQLDRPTKEQEAWQERQRLIGAINNASADEEAKARARTAVELGASPKEMLETLGIDSAGQKAKQEQKDILAATLTKSLGDKLEGAYVARSKSRIDDLIDNSLTATGASGYVASYLPFDTASYQLNQELNTLKAIVGFDRLEQMREESKTGGALGQVSEKELMFLQAVQGSLDQFQDPQILKENVADVAAAHAMFREMRSLVQAAQSGDTSVIERIGQLGGEINAIGQNVALRQTPSSLDIAPTDEGAAYEQRY